MIRILIFLSLFYFGLTSQSYAYIDPSAVNLILQFFAILLTSIITGWLFLKNYINYKFKKIFKSNNRIIFYFGYPIRLVKSFFKMFRGNKKKTSQESDVKKFNKPS